MNTLIFVVLIVSLSCNKIYCNILTPTGRVTLPKLEKISTTNEHKNLTNDKVISWRDLILPKYKPSTMTELRKAPNTEVDYTNRKSKILGSLAFLAGLGVRGLANVASSSMKSHARIPPVSHDNSRTPSQVSPLFDPYPYITHPYFVAGPFGLYSILHPLQLRPEDAQSGLQTLLRHQFLQALNLLDNKKPTDPSNNNERYAEEAKKTENDKTANDGDEETEESVELQVENDRNAEEKMASGSTTCGTHKGSNKKQTHYPKNTLKERQDLQEDAAGLSAALSFRQDAKKPDAPVNSRNDQTAALVADPNQNNGTSITNSSGINNTQTVYPPFNGYYGGQPQDINQIDFTTDSTIYKHHDYGHYPYLPPHEKPANFYSDDRYNYYSPPHYNSYPSYYQHDPVPEYYSPDYGRVLHTPDNTPPHGSGFRPVK